jgi:holo-ACP synthase CitX
MADVLFRKISLAEMLAAREQRAAKRLAYASLYETAVVSFTMNIPGPQKASRMIHRAFDQGFQTFLHTLELGHIEFLEGEFQHLSTGPEGYIAVETEARIVKTVAVNFEQSHPIGRLFDIDVLSQNLNLLSRRELGMPERKCLLCSGNARECARSSRHGLQELTETIETMLQMHFSNEMRDFGGFANEGNCCRCCRDNRDNGGKGVDL